jgi:hypothetical protein
MHLRESELQCNPRQGWWEHVIRFQVAKTRTVSNYRINSPACVGPSAARWPDLANGQGLSFGEPIFPNCRRCYSLIARLAGGSESCSGPKAATNWAES